MSVSHRGSYKLDHGVVSGLHHGFLVFCSPWSIAAGTMVYVWRLRSMVLLGVSATMVSVGVPWCADGGLGPWFGRPKANHGFASDTERGDFSRRRFFLPKSAQPW